jgi:hypothetical protein
MKIVLQGIQRFCTSHLLKVRPIFYGTQAVSPDILRVWKCWNHGQVYGHAFLSLTLGHREIV